MNLTMNILADELKSFDFEAYIPSGSTLITGIHLGDEFNAAPAPDVLNISKAHSSGDIRIFSIICTQGNNRLTFRNLTNQNTIINIILDLYHKYTTAEMQLNELIFSGKSFQSFIDYCSSFISKPIVVSDAFFNLISYSGINENYHDRSTLMNYIKTSHLDIDTLSKLNHLYLINRASKKPYVFEYSNNYCTVITNLYINGEYSANLYFISYKECITPGFLELCSYISGVAEKFITLNNTAHSFATETKLFKDLLNNATVNHTETIQYLKTLSWYENDMKTLIKLSNTGKTIDSSDIDFLLLINSVPNAFSLLYDDCIVIIANIENTTVNELLARIGKLINTESYSIGISFSFRDIFDLRKNYIQASLALNYGMKKGEKISYCEQYLLPYACNIIKNNVITDIIHPAIATLREYDNKHNTELSKTLSFYLDYERNLVLTAAKLNIHRNSLVYRISKIEQLTGLSFDEPELRTYIKLCYLMLED